MEKSEDQYFIEEDTTALLLGSSRVGHYDKEQVSSKVGGGKVKVFSVPGAPYKILYKYLIHASAHSNIEYVLINLDFLSANKILENQYPINEHKFYPLSARGNKLYFTYFKIVSCLKDLIDLKSIQTFFQNQQERLKADSYYNEKPILEKCAAVEGHFINECYFMRPQRQFLYNAWKDANPNSSLYYLQKIMEFCHENNIRLDLPIGPIHSRFSEIQYEFSLKKAVDLWKKDLVKLNQIVSKKYNKHPFLLLDFTGFNTVTTEDLNSDNINYYCESSHFSESAARLVVEDLFSPNPPQLGVVITEDNISEHLDMFWKKYMAYHKDSQIKYKTFHQDLKNYKKLSKRTGICTVTIK